MYTACVVGASGYTGAELIKLIKNHPQLSLCGCYVSENSQYADMKVCDVHTELMHISDLSMQALDAVTLGHLKDRYDVIFLATPHEFSHDNMPALIGGKAKIFDLSGAFRIKDKNTFADFYGFSHQHPEILKNAVYGLAEWYKKDITQAQYIAVPGCYPTASLLALKPLINSDLLNLSHIPVINATSGVSGAGRKASMTTSFYEVSLQAYGVLSHRHTPEIESYANQEVIFTPHLGAFKRGILATITAFSKDGVSAEDIKEAYVQAYQNSPLVRLRDNMPKVDQVAHTPFCDISFSFDSAKKCVVIGSAIDNLMKGASSQAIQCCNISLGLDESEGLI